MIFVGENVHRQILVYDRDGIVSCRSLEANSRRQSFRRALMRSRSDESHGSSGSQRCAHS